VQDHRLCRFQYLAKKKANEAKKKQVCHVVKELSFRPGTERARLPLSHEPRASGCRKATRQSDNLVPWPQMTHRELGARILDKLEKDLADISEVEMRPRMEGNQMSFSLDRRDIKAAESQSGRRRRSLIAAASLHRPPRPLRRRLRMRSRLLDLAHGYHLRWRRSPANGEGFQIQDFRFVI